MIDDSREFQSLLYTVTEIAKADGADDIVGLLTNSQVTIQQTNYDNWNGGTYGYTIYICVDVKTFINYRDKKVRVLYQRDHRRHSKECLFSFIHAAVAVLRKIVFQRKSINSYRFGYLSGYLAKSAILGNRMMDGSLKKFGTTQKYFKVFHS